MPTKKKINEESVQKLLTKVSKELKLEIASSLLESMPNSNAVQRAEKKSRAVKTLLVFRIAVSVSLMMIALFSFVYILKNHLSGWAYILLSLTGLLFVVVSFGLKYFDDIHWDEITFTNIFEDMYNGLVFGSFADELGLVGYITQASLAFVPIIGTIAAFRDFRAARAERDRIGMILNGLALIPFLGIFPKTAYVLRDASLNSQFNTFGEYVNDIDASQQINRPIH